MPNIYNAALKGYVADVPKVVFRRCDGHAYAFNELVKAVGSNARNDIVKSLLNGERLKKR